VFKQKSETASPATAPDTDTVVEEAVA